MAAENNHVETLNKLWIWAEEMQLNPKALGNELFVAKDKNTSRSTWHQEEAV